MEYNWLNPKAQMRNTPGKGFVAKEFVVGRAFVISWPFAHFSWLDNFPDVFKNVPAPKP